MQRIGIIGDLHAEHERLEIALDYLHGVGVDAIICTGDIADGRGDLDRCCELLRQAQVLSVAGNHDRWFLQDKVRHVDGAHLRHEATAETVAYIQRLPKTRTLSTIGGALILCHGMLDDDLAKIWPGSENASSRCSTALDELLAEPDPPRFIINGHMHFRTVIDFPRTQVINAGTLKGQFAGFSLLDVTQCQLESLNFSPNNEPSMACRMTLGASQGRRVWQSTEEFDGQWQPVVLHRA
ncbi:MAG: metallophosphoesterase [Proteobacteria bacterium]|nr:metallophosphoesterase [Pseudomonadota bacterium]